MTVQKLKRRPLFVRENRTLNRLIFSENMATLIGVLIAAVHTGFVSIFSTRHVELKWMVFLAVLWVSFSRLWRFFVYADRKGFMRLVQARLILPLLWLTGMLVLWKLNAADIQHDFSVAWSDLIISLIAATGVLSYCRNLAARTRNSAVLLIGSFAVVITIGTLLLKLPACRPVTEAGVHQAADWNVALFTATSATCVTGLIVEPTGSYWSPLGHAVIFSLFQIGGFGILTFGAFMAVLSGRHELQLGEADTLRDMLDSENVNSVRRILLTIVTFTVFIEAIGAACLLGMSSERPWIGRLWDSVFHSVSAFCNAGFSLRDDGFLGMGTRWQVWGPLSFLIILGGLGFPVISDMSDRVLSRFRRRQIPLFHPRRRVPGLTVHSRLVLITTAVLLISGSVLWFTLETLSASSDASIVKRMADAWFQSVTFRTAGFNSVDHGSMHPASKLLAIFLMFIGAAPGSTGGGVKTVVFAVTVLNVWSVIRGRDCVEVFGRRIPTSQVARSLAMIAVGIGIVLMTTGLLVIFEQQPERFLDHLFEATSAFGTAGVSAGITPTLSMPSRLLICGVMFLGRVGPITLLLAMATSSETGRYQYPEERVSLG